MPNQEDGEDDCDGGGGGYSGGVLQKLCPNKICVFPMITVT